MKKDTNLYHSKTLVILEENYSSHALLNALAEDLHIKDYDGDAGVWEGYTIRQHTLMVLLQFDRYFAHKPLPLNMSVQFWRLLLAIHDVLGKPEALQQGNKQLQHKILYAKLPTALKHLGYTKYETRVGQELLSNSCIGSLIQGHTSTPEVIAQVQRLSAVARGSTDDALFAMVLYWMVDAGSYTKDAGGKPSLDYLFHFDHKKHTMGVIGPASVTLLELKEAVRHSS